MEFAFRVGRETGRNQPKQLLVRLYDKTIRDEIMRSSKTRSKTAELRPIFLQDDMTPSTYKLRKKLGTICNKPMSKANSHASLKAPSKSPEQMGRNRWYPELLS